MGFGYPDYPGYRIPWWYLFFNSGLEALCESDLRA
jgi:hypothetical protein